MCQLLNYVALFILCIILIKVILKLNLRFCKCKTCLSGKTVIITGGNSGLGFQTAVGLASRGCRVIIADKDDSSKSVKQIITKTKNLNIIYKHIDLSSFDSIRKFAEDITQNEKRLDILINNAGIAGTSGQLSRDGLNLEMQVNHFGPFLLTHLLIDLLKKSSPSKIIFVSSIMAFVGNLSEENINKRRNDLLGKLGLGTYSNSKLGNMITSKVLSEKLKQFGVTSNCVHPGGVATNIFFNNELKSAWYKFVSNLCYYTFIQLFGKTAEEGAQSSIHLALCDSKISGKYFMNCQEFQFQAYQTYDKKICEKIYNVSANYVKLSDIEKL